MIGKKRAFALAVTLGFATLARASGTPAELSRLIAQTHAKDDIVKKAAGLLKHEYLVPSGPYTQLFDWDTYFMGVALSYDRMSQPLIGSVEDFLELVNRNASDPGYVPREIATDGLWALPEACKPFLAQAAVRAAETAGDYSWLTQPLEPLSWLERLRVHFRAALARFFHEKPTLPIDDENTPYGRLKLTLSFWERSRRAADGLFVWYNGMESGVDNNPAVSYDPSLATEGVDLQVYLYREYLAVAKLGDELGRASEAATFRARAEALRSLMTARMWDERDGTFYNLDARTGQPIRISTWTNLTPLWAKIPAPEAARRMIEQHLLSPAEFWGAHGVRSLAATEPGYNASAGYWQGPVWTVSNYLMMRGLLNYGYRAQAVELAQKTLDLLVDDLEKTGGMNECYDPETGAPAGSGHFVSWSLLAEHMLDEAQSGDDPTAL